MSALVLLILDLSENDAVFLFFQTAILNLLQCILFNIRITDLEPLLHVLHWYTNTGL